MTATKTRILTEAEWDALAAVEKPLYKDEHGLHPYTSVAHREDSEFAAELWDYAEIGAEMLYDLSDDSSGHNSLRNECARRVAHALATLAGGVGYFPVPR